MFNTINTGGQLNGGVIAATLRRPDIRGYVRHLRRDNFRMIEMRPRDSNGVDLGSFRGTVSRGAVLMSMVTIGGRINSIVPARGLGGVVGDGGSPTLLRISSIRNCVGVPLYPGDYKVSLVDIDTRGIRNPGNIKTLCVGGGIHVGPCVLNNNRRGGVYSKARNVPTVTNFTTTIRGYKDIRGGLGCATGLGLHLERQVGRVPKMRVGSPRGTLPCVVGVSVSRVPSRMSMGFFSVGNMCVSTNSTYSGKREDGILRDVKLPPSEVSSTVQVDLSGSASVSRVSHYTSIVGVTIRGLEGRGKWEGDGVGRVVLVGGKRLTLGNLGHSSFRSALTGGVGEHLRSLKGFGMVHSRSAVAMRPFSRDFSVRRTRSRVSHVFNVTNCRHTTTIRGSVSMVLGAAPICLDRILGGTSAFGIRTGHTSGAFPLGSPRVYYSINRTILGTFPRVEISIGGPSLAVMVRVHRGTTCVRNSRGGNTNNVPINANNGTTLLVSKKVSDPITN